MTSTTSLAVPQIKVVNNEYSILDKADLVMIDPIRVGFSKPIGKSKWEDFWGVDQDIRSIICRKT